MCGCKTMQQAIPCSRPPRLVGQGGQANMGRRMGRGVWAHGQGGVGR